MRKRAPCSRRRADRGLRCKGDTLGSRPISHSIIRIAQRKLGLADEEVRPPLPRGRKEIDGDRQEAEPERLSVCRVYDQRRGDRANDAWFAE